MISDAGPHPYFRTLIQGSERDPASFTVGCVGPAGDLQEDMRDLGVSTFALGASTRAGYPAAVVRLARMLRKREVQVVQTHLVDGSLVGLSAARVARTPVSVMTAHHSHELPFHGRKLILAERLCAGPLSDHIIAPSLQVARTLMELARASESKIDVVHHGFDLARLDPAAVDGTNVRGELGLDGRLVFTAIGRIFHLKNYSALLRAFAEGVAQEPSASLLIVGAGDQVPLRSLASSLGLGDRVVLAGQRRDIPEVLAATDVFVHPAIAESFGMVIVEAMAMARPVVSTPVGIAPEVIESGKSGLLSPSPEPGALGESLGRMLKLRSAWPAIGAAARQSVEAFTAASMAARYENLYRTWLDPAWTTGRS